MSIIDAVTYAIGEASAFLVGRLVGRTFRLEPKKAQRIGENIVIAIVVGGLIVVTFAYS